MEQRFVQRKKGRRNDAMKPTTEQPVHQSETHAQSDPKGSPLLDLLMDPSVDLEAMFGDSHDIPAVKRRISQKRR